MTQTEQDKKEHLSELNKKRCKKWRLNNLEKIREIDRIRRLNNPNYHKNWRKAHPIQNKMRKKRQHLNERIKYPDRINAWKNDYRKRKSYCELCGSKDKLEFHHIDYILHSGITVCFKCHRYKIHNKSVEDYKPLQLKEVNQNGRTK